MVVCPLSRVGQSCPARPFVIFGRDWVLVPPNFALRAHTARFISNDFSDFDFKVTEIGIVPHPEAATTACTCIGDGFPKPLEDIAHLV